MQSINNFNCISISACEQIIIDFFHLRIYMPFCVMITWFAIYYTCMLTIKL